MPEAMIRQMKSLCGCRNGGDYIFRNTSCTYRPTCQLIRSTLGVVVLQCAGNKWADRVGNVGKLNVSRPRECGGSLNEEMQSASRTEKHMVGGEVSGYGLPGLAMPQNLCPACCEAMSRISRVLENDWLKLGTLSTWCTGFDPFPGLTRRERASEVGSKYLEAWERRKCAACWSIASY